MKVGILTFYRVINNGAALQACATNRIVLKKLGVESELIDYRLPRVEYYRKPFSIMRALQAKGIKGKVRAFAKECVKYPDNIRRFRLYNMFMGKYLKTSTHEYCNIEELGKDANNYDAFVVGSDLVWNPLMAEGVNPVYYLDFVEDPNVKKIAYAPSIGTLDITDAEKRQISQYLKKFDAISVREESSRKQLQELTDKPVHTVLDPSLLTFEEDWDEFYDQIPIEKEKYIFAFKLEKSPVLIEVVNKLAKKENAIIVAYGSTVGFKARKVKDVSGRMGPSEFLNYIKNASHVVTNSYHGCAFSIVFHKEFYCIPHSTRGLRMVDLLHMLQIPERLIYTEDISGIESLNYKKLDSIRKQYIDSSLRYLTDALFGDIKND